VARLEDRSVPATFGVPWAGGTVSLSFPADGTPAAGRTSDLGAGLGQSHSVNEWQLDILSAFHAWASVTSLDIAVVPDSNQPFGTPGRFQNDPRFGDVRVGGSRLASDVLAVTSPPDPALSGTLAGDVFVNTRYRFDGSPHDLRSVILHEAGHALGLDHSTDPASPMYPRFNNTGGALTAADIQAIRNLYGTRRADRFEGSAGNGTTATATAIPVPAGYAGATPLVAFADLTTTDDADVFRFDTLVDRDDDESATVRVQSAGVSLLGARVTVYRLDAAGNEQEVANVTADAADYAGDTLVVPFDASDDDDGSAGRYYVRVEAAADAPFRTGRYAVAVTMNQLNTVPEADLDAVIRGPYRTLGANDLASLLRNPAARVNVDGGTNDTPATATPVAVTATAAGVQRSEAVGSIQSAGDADVYRLTAPTDGRPLALIVSGLALQGEAAGVRVEVLDAAGAVVPTEILVNDSGTFTVQATDLAPGATVFARVTGGVPGNYLLTADFRTTAAQVVTFAERQLAAGTMGTDKVFVGQSQLFHFALTATGPAGTAVRMTATDAAGNDLFTLTANAGDTVSVSGRQFRPGEYRVRYEAVGGPVGVRLRGNRITDPVGPVLDDPTLQPIYTPPGGGNGFFYPGGTFTLSPWYWLFADL
jgi:hypothetical protein